MKCYLCKYISRRHDFIQTMNAKEQALMDGHVTFLNDLLAQKTIVAHGPVMDPACPYGVSLFCIADDQSIEERTARAPLVVGDCGYYEHHPMMHLTAND